MTTDQADKNGSAKVHSVRMRAAYIGVVIVEIVVLLALWVLSQAFGG